MRHEIGRLMSVKLVSPFGGVQTLFRCLLAMAVGSGGLQFGPTDAIAQQRASLKIGDFKNSRVTPSQHPTNQKQRDYIVRAFDLAQMHKRIVAYAAKRVDQKGLGEGQCTELVEAALENAGAWTGNTADSNDYVWGTPVTDPALYRPGYIIQFHNCLFQKDPRNKNAGWKAMEPRHSSIIEKVNGKVLTLLEQNVDGSPATEKSHVRRRELDLGWTLMHGTYKAYSPIRPNNTTTQSQQSSTESRKSDSTETRKTGSKATPNYQSQTLRIGAKGPAVEILQRLLNESGVSVEVDGNFGLMTERAVRNFQARRGLNVDGVVGLQTWKALRSS